MFTSTVILAAAITLSNASIPPTPETLSDKIVVLVCGPQQQVVLTNVKEIPTDCKVVKEYTTTGKK